MFSSSKSNTKPPPTSLHSNTSTDMDEEHQNDHHTDDDDAGHHTCTMNEHGNRTNNHGTTYNLCTTTVETEEDTIRPKRRGRGTYNNRNLHSSSGGSHNNTGSIPQQGHRFCYCCCDMKRAVVIVNIIFIFELLLDYTLVQSTEFELRQMITQNITLYDDDTKNEEIVTLSNEYNPTIFLIHTLTKIMCCVTGIIGSIQYNAKYVSVAGFMYLYTILEAFIYFSTVSTVFIIVPITSLFLYPHVAYIYQNRIQKIMLHENYENVKQSCCCV